MSEQITLRLAPSPTGDLHLGNAMVALANWWFAQESVGKLILRIDDTDRQRSSIKSLNGITDALDWLGITYDTGPVFQSKHDGLYSAAIQKMLEDGTAYRCFCTVERLEEVARSQRSSGQPPRYDMTCRHLSTEEADRLVNLNTPFVVRIRVPERDFGFDDLVHGGVAAPSGSFGDFILRRADGTHGYMFASVIDDVDMKISHVLRGSDHLANTPRQMAIFDALDAEPPRWAHLPLLLSEQGSKLSKRDQMGSMNQLISTGIPPNALRRYLSEMLGQGGEDPLEPGSKVAFNFGKVSTGAAKTSITRLESLAREVIGETKDEEARKLIDAELKASGFAALKDAEWLLANDMRSGAIGWKNIADDFASIKQYNPGDAKLSLNDLPESLVDQAISWLETEKITALPDAVRVVGEIKKECRKQGVPIKAVLQLLRSCLTGSTDGPGIDLLLIALGREEAVYRIKKSLQ